MIHILEKIKCNSQVFYSSKLVRYVITENVTMSLNI